VVAGNPTSEGVQSGSMSGDPTRPLEEASRLRDSAGFSPDFATHRATGSIPGTGSLGHRTPRGGGARIPLRTASPTLGGCPSVPFALR